MTYLRIAAVALTILFAALLIWRPLQGLIDGGMRGGVPRAQGSNVVTLYEEGAKARAFVGDGGDRAQVVLLDAAGAVAFHDAGGVRESSARRLAAALAAMADEH